MPRTYNRLPPEVNRILYVRNLPFKISSDDLYDIFGKYGAIRQIRIGTEKKTKGSAFIIYEDIFDAKNAVENLSGFNVGGRYLVILYYKPEKREEREAVAQQRRDLEKLKQAHGL